MSRSWYWPLYSKSEKCNWIYIKVMP